jgi:hypothetical protein
MVVKISDSSPVPDELMWSDLEPQGSPPASPRATCRLSQTEEPPQRGTLHPDGHVLLPPPSSSTGIQSDHEPRREEVEDVT